MVWSKLSRTGVIRRHFERRVSPGQLISPILQLFCEYVAGQPFALPLCKVRILNRQLREQRVLLRRESFIERGYFTHQHAHGPAVGNDVMHDQQRHVLGLTQAQQCRAQQWSMRQVERSL